MSSEKRKAQLQKIKEKLNNPNISLLEAGNLSREFLMVYANNPAKSQDEFEKEEFFLQDEIDTKTSKIYFDYIDQWEKKQVSPNEQELKFLDLLIKSIPAIRAFAEQAKENMNKAKQLSEEEKKTIIESIKKKEESWKKYQPILRQLIEQAERERVKRRKKIRLILQKKSKFLQLPNPLKLPLPVQIAETIKTKLLGI
ncbi:hypothetical protein [endosymbiont GvMRE of Glomus versiforme]|uniref:hypothetical protein n=1 Tax=endosymbiont GvMRE of Glomus versiforme TaxID=2039283 RepID=UPI000EED8BA1|nr:hypothetical protein [endosymbiont GvMRE of Glomus versiforme]RHZ36410.1 hypothetical protein GvMRE_Ic1g192 [endosymbiont GvMRE of Glomus versiforme]